VSDIVLDGLCNKQVSTNRAGARQHAFSYPTAFLLPRWDNSQGQLTILDRIPKSFMSQYATVGTSHEEADMRKRKFDPRGREDITRCELNGIAVLPQQENVGADHEF
jgi:hypothetical protein